MTKFYDKEHENAFYNILNRMKNTDCYHQAVAYLFALDTVCRQHLDDLFDFDENLIKRDGLHNGWQTGTSTKTTRLAFNLWNGCSSDGDTYLDEDGYKSDLPSSAYSVAEIFCCSYAPYYYEAIKIRYPEYAN